MTRSRLPIVITLIAALVLSAVTRDWARGIRNRGETNLPGSAAATNSLANMDSFALALLLGGLRGPLVMVLWTSSENQKNEKDLEDFDTKVEWIRLLQPEFDTVHIFQVWNKAYNISVQMASLANKYSTILDAIDYAQRVEAARPNNINMLYAIGGIYFDKLGQSTEKNYYKTRVREESLPHPTRQKLARNDPAWRRLELDPVLDNKGMILPDLLKPRFSKPASIKGDEWNNGSELQYLAKYQPFPYGISTFGFAYNYHKRAQVLQSTLKEQHAQLSTMVVDSRPALALKNWEEAESERGRRLELRAFNHPIPEDREDMDLPTADLAPDAPFSSTERTGILQAIESYHRAARLAPDAIAEYQRHLKGYSTNYTTYQSHMDECRALGNISAGDAAYLEAMLAPAAERAKLLATSGDAYRKARDETYLVMFKYYIDDELAAATFPSGIRRSNVDQLPSSMYEPVFQKIKAASASRRYDPSAEDRLPWEHELSRVLARLKNIDASQK